MVRADSGRFELPRLRPNETVFSDVERLPNREAPITVAVEFMDTQGGVIDPGFPPPNQPVQREWPNVSLTVYYVEDNNAFRVAATNLSAIAIERTVVRWWRLDV